MRTALLWLEESHLLKREQNRVQVFPSSLKVTSIEDADRRLAKMNLTDEYRGQLHDLIRSLIEANADEGLSTDELSVATALTTEGVRRALYDLEHLEIASNDTALTAFVHRGVGRSSKRHWAEAAE